VGACSADQGDQDDSASSSSEGALVSRNHAANVVLVNNFYRDLLQRPATGDPGSNYWVGLLDNGADTTSVARAIISSREFGTKQAAGLFTRFLKRPASASDLAFFGGQIRRTVTITLTASDEYYALNGSNPLSFVNALYRDVLGRAGEPTGVSFWVGQLARGASRTQVAAGFNDSTEYHTRQAKVLGYQNLLRRAPDAGGLAGWVSALDSQRIIIEDMLAGFAGSAEYYNGPGRQP
jgi:hypothetical protein